MRLRPAFLAAIVAGFAPLAAPADEILNIGDPAPPLTVSGFVKGEKVEKFEAGKTYVVEFWATWCGPCRATIPHLTELAHKYKDQGVRFIGVDVWEQDTKLVQPFLEMMGDKMDYSVALDDVPAGEKPADGKMAKGWMAASEANGIPTAFVVHDGKLAWIGHPIEMDEPLALITAGKWDPKPAAQKRLAEKMKERKYNAVMAKVYKPLRKKDYKATLAAIEEVSSGDADLAEQFAPIKFQALCNLDDADAALACGEKLYEANKDDAMGLNNTFWNVVDPDRKSKPDDRLAQLALKAARRAVELTKGEDMANLDTLAHALFCTGDPAGAVEAEEKAQKRLEATVTDRNHPYYAQFAAGLEKFRKAAKAKADVR